MVDPHHELAVIDDRIDHGFGTPGDLRRRARLEAGIAVAGARSELESIQRNATHAMIGELPTRAVCPKCPVKHACRRASLALADAETKVIGGVDG